MERKKIRIGFVVVAFLCVLGCSILHLRKEIAERGAGPGKDMMAIAEHLSEYDNNHESHAKIKNLAVIETTSKFVKIEPWDAFTEKVRAGETAWVDMVSYTTEGDSIFYYLHYDGTEFLFVKDTTRDKFGMQEIFAEKFTGLYEFEVESEDGAVIYYAILSSTELTSYEHADEVFREVLAEFEAGEFDPMTEEYQRFPYTVVSVRRK